MKKKIFSILSLLVISLTCAVTLSGCGSGVGVEDVTKSYETMIETLEENSDIFNNAGALNTAEYYEISYGDVVDKYIDDGSKYYVDLKDYYNSVFSFAMSYMSENRTVITNITDEELNSEAKGTLSALKSSIDDFTAGIQDFVDARNRLDLLFQRIEDTSPSADERLTKLRDFKREYVNFVNKSVEMSLSLSNSVEATGILDDVSNVRLTKNYICNKILNVYNELYILDIGTFNFAASVDTTTKERIQTLLDTLHDSMLDYTALMQMNNKDTLSEEELGALREMTDKFMTEIDVYVKALDSLDIRTLSVDYKNDMAEYLNHNNRAEIYLERVENFINISLPEFLNYVEDVVKII